MLQLSLQKPKLLATCPVRFVGALLGRNDMI